MNKRILKGNIVPLVLIIIILLAAVAASFIFKAPPACADCNVIVIGVDTLRADTVHSFGYPKETTPTIDALAAKGFTFTQAISASSWTVPSFMSIMTGTYPSVHGVINKFVEFTPGKQTLSNLHQISPDIKTLAEAMKGAGYATGGFTGDAGVSAKFGYGQGFDTYTDEKTFGGFENSRTHALTWLDSLNGKKFFMFFHGYDLHGQFNLSSEKEMFVPKDYTGTLTGSAQEEAALREEQLAHPLTATPEDVAFWRGLYDSKVLAADTALKGFLDELDKRGLLKNTVIVLVSDHGEEYFEHGGIDHGHALYDELVHVPLTFVVPGKTGGIVPAQVSTMDVASTILSLVGVSDDVFAKQTGTHNLMKYFTNPKASGEDVYTETDYRDFTHKRSIRTADGWKYIVTLESGKEELYNLSQDSGEQQNLVSSNPDKTKELKERLRTHISVDLHANPDAPVTTGCLPVYQGECE